MKLRITLLLAAVTVLSAVPAKYSQADLVAYWNFNALSIGTPASPGTGGVPLNIAADAGVGSGNLDLSSWTATIDDLAGTTLNALFSDVAGPSLTFKGNTPSFIDFTVDLTGLKDPIITFANGGNANGYTSGTWQWSNDGSTFNNITGNTASQTAFALATVDLTGVAGLVNQANVTFRYTLSGGGVLRNNQMDNVQINAVSTIPEPGTAGLVGLLLVGVVARRRRR